MRIIAQRIHLSSLICRTQSPKSLHFPNHQTFSKQLSQLWPIEQLCSRCGAPLLCIHARSPARTETKACDDNNGRGHKTHIIYYTLCYAVQLRVVVLLLVVCFVRLGEKCGEAAASAVCLPPSSPPKCARATNGDALDDDDGRRGTAANEFEFGHIAKLSANRSLVVWLNVLHILRTHHPYGGF